MRKFHLLLVHLLALYRYKLHAINFISSEPYVCTSVNFDQIFGQWLFMYLNQLSIAETWKCKWEFFLQSDFVYGVNLCVLCWKKQRQPFCKEIMPTAKLLCFSVSHGLCWVPLVFFFFSLISSVSPFSFIDNWVISSTYSCTNSKGRIFLGQLIIVARMGQRFFCCCCCCLFCFVFNKVSS